RESLLVFLQRLQQEEAEAQQYSYTSLVRVQGWSQIPPGQPLFQSLLVFENYPVNVFEETYQAAPRVNGSHPAPFHILDRNNIERTNYPLELVFYPGDELTIRVTHDSHQLSEIAVERVIDELKALLEGIVANPERSICELPVLTDAERRQLEEWNRTEQGY